MTRSSLPSRSKSHKAGLEVCPATFRRARSPIFLQDNLAIAGETVSVPSRVLRIDDHVKTRIAIPIADGKLDSSGAATSAGIQAESVEGPRRRKGVRLVHRADARSEIQVDQVLPRQANRRHQSRWRSAWCATASRSRRRIDSTNTTPAVLPRPQDRTRPRSVPIPLGAASQAWTKSSCKECRHRRRHPSRQR